MGSQAQAALGVRKHGLRSRRRPAEEMGVTRFLLDTHMAGHYINRRHEVFDRARIEVANGNPLGIGVPVLPNSSPASSTAAAATAT